MGGAAIDRGPPVAVETGQTFRTASQQTGMPDTITTPDIAIDRSGIVAFLRRALAEAEAMPRARLHGRQARPSGLPLELWFDSAAQADLYAPRLAECAPVPGAAATRLYVLDSMGQLPGWADEAFDAPAFHALLRDAGLRAAYPHQPQIWQVLDLGTGIGLHLARSTDDLPLWHAGSPLRQHLHWLLQAQGKRIAHAATLGEAGRGILLFGSGGAGKSGTTLAGVAAGLQSVGDDYVALGGAAQAVATPLYRIFKQDRRGLARVGGLQAKTADMPENWMRKVEFDPTLFFPDCFVEEMEIRAIVLPRIARAESSRFVAIPGGEAMRGLIPTNLMQFPGEADDGMAYYANLLRRLPAYRLELSSDAAECGAALRSFIAGL